MHFPLLEESLLERDGQCKNDGYWYQTHLEMPQLPHARRNQDANLRDCVPHCTRVRSFAQITEGRLALALVLLFTADVFELLVQVAEFL